MVVGGCGTMLLDLHTGHHSYDDGDDEMLLLLPSKLECENDLVEERGKRKEERGKDTVLPVDQKGLENCGISGLFWTFPDAFSKNGA